jgi:hypothetical protein
MIMELNLLITFGILAFLCAVAAIDELLSQEMPLGEEWDFLTPISRRNS